ncbi:putative fad-dependent pyridine nucleotide-disulfide oxidoreductase protein [Zalerion maritima]|uniref:Fad-dependent pyridine nucleotide-disulfide oxidoreductase protein n=1 Tax=Zalerion maritima TaxID=339359 RepID=A0AAD5RLC2_9PEZI|nr:putative fad-dependent pyridine nucleotide-disulfide oxidoreductase protein [Zalerion maritima]
MAASAAAAYPPGRNIVIVGGVAGGMSCATRLRRLDETAHITVLEKGPYPSFANCGIPYALSGIISDESKLHVQTVPKLNSWFNLDVKVNHEVLSIDRAAKKIKYLSPATKEEEELPYDKLVLAQGADAFVPPIEGVGAKHVFKLTTIPDLQDIQAYIAERHVKKAAVIGAGFIGIEAAENLDLLGLDVTLYEFAPHVFPLIDGDLANVLHEEMKKNKMNLAMGAQVYKITPPDPEKGTHGMVYAKNAPDTEADLVIVAVGVRARTGLAKESGLEVGKTGMVVNDQMQTSDPDIYAVGDMVETEHVVTGARSQLALAGPANRQGRMAADHMCGKEVRYRGNVGTSVCKVFKQTAGLVGFSTRSLEKMGVPFEYVTVHPPDHAGYYPGSAPMTMKVAFSPADGKLLGAQLVGTRNVDKRIDVLATAMRAGMTIEDLEHLELAYSPPYGSAKDPVNMAGFAGGNLLRGDVEILHAADFAPAGREQLEDYFVVDVRSAEEFGRGHVKGALNLPIATLRETLDQVPKDKKVLVYCWVGYRGYLGYRVFKQLGYEVRNLDGGFKAVSEGGYEALVE